MWPRLSSLRGPVRACALPYPTLGVARDPALCPALPSPLEAGDGGPRTVSEDDAGQGHPVKEGMGGEKAPRTRGFTSQTRHISEGLQAQTHVGLPLLPGVATDRRKVSCELAHCNVFLLKTYLPYALWGKTLYMLCG